MHFSIRYKLLLTLLLSTALVVAVMLAFTSWSFQRGFTGFVEDVQQARIRTLTVQLAEIYDEEQGWERLARSPRRWVRLVMNRSGEEHHENHHGDDDDHLPLLRRLRHEQSGLWPPRWRGTPPEHQPFAFRVMLLDAGRQIIFGRPERQADLQLHPISLRGETVGYLGVLPGPALSQLGELRFLERQRHAFLLIGLAMLGLSGALALFLASRLVRPVRAFTEGSRALAAGRYDTRIPVQSRDELGQLAHDFNALAEALEKNEQLRRQWVADISHELRTPLAVIRGELEALQDGVRPFTAEAVGSLHTDVLRLGRLIEDLYELSMSDLGALDYRKLPTDPVAVLRDDIEALRPAFVERGLTLSLDDRLPAAVQFDADPDRLSQLFRNLLTNSLNYTDPGGRLAISTSRRDDQLVVDFQDTAPAVSAEDLPRLFDRLYRVEPSRSRSHGGAGLGLAICRNIVEAHGGRISAQASPLGGVWIQLSLPLQP